MHLQKFSLHLSSLSFVIRVNFFNPQLSLFLYGLLLSFWCFFYRLMVLYVIASICSLDLASGIFLGGPL